jgi:hypothetical protein
LPLRRNAILAIAYFPTLVLLVRFGFSHLADHEAFVIVITPRRSIASKDQHTVDVGSYTLSMNKGDEDASS